MQPSEAYQYITHSQRRERVLTSLSQPLTAKQIARRTGMAFDSCRDAVRDLAAHRLVHCLNETSRRSRVYWLTRLGKACQRQLCATQAKPAPERFAPDIDWTLYGWVCYTHRSAIIKALISPMQPATIKRKARSRQADLRMSGNNVRDVMRVFLQRGIVQAVWIRKHAHPLYELTDHGQVFQQLLCGAEVPA